MDLKPLWNEYHVCYLLWTELKNTDLDFLKYLVTPFLFVWSCSSVRKGYLSEDTKKHGWVCVLEVIVVPSRLRLIRKTVVLTRVLPTLDLNCEKNTARRKRKSPLFDYKETFMYYERQVRICLLLIDKARAQDKTYIWVSVWWKTKT